MYHGDMPLPDTVVQGRNGMGPYSEDTKIYATGCSIVADSVHMQAHSVRRAVHKTGCQRQAAAVTAKNLVVVRALVGDHKNAE
jgi:hypothetical protein